jgi:hypothetical protein
MPDDGARPAANLRTPVGVSCPVDNTPIEADDLTWFFRFPGDGDAVIDFAMSVQSAGALCFAWG